MNISYKWLKEYVDFDLSAEQVAEALTSEGLEVGQVEEVQAVKGGLQGLVIGHVLTCEPHPNSDHMHVCTVNIGQPDPVQIVCGAANVAAGQKVVVATLGCKLYSGDECFTIKKSKLRGVESNGMICAEDEIGLGNDHSGIIVLPDSAVPGTPAASYYNLQSDYLIEVDITPNRADACSHYGVARDLYAWLLQNGYQTSLHRPTCDGYATDSHDLEIDVEVRNTEACPRYAAVTLKNCKVAPSPEWLQDRLRIIGLRPINNIVDVTNYIMHAYGQPLHCFDADMITGRKIVVDTMPEGTPFVTLDGAEHKLSNRDLAICNTQEPMCIAGVFGGKGSGTYDTTSNILLESAYFNPTWIRKSARRHGLSTDASFRFERGIDPNGTIYALKQAAMLCKELAGGEIAMEIKDVYPNPLPDFEVDLKYDYAYSLMGKHIGNDTVKRIVTSLEMQILEDRPDGLKLRVPAYRVDVQRPCDVVEDILRVYGYNNVEIPSSVKSTLNVKGEEDKSHKLQNLVAEQLVGAGFNEILNNSLQRAAYYDNLQAYPADRLVKLINPLSSDLNAMRQTLLFGGLECIAHNANRKNADLKFFEFGNCYYYNEAHRCPDIIPGVSSSREPEVIKHVLDAYSEDYHLALWVTGKRVSGSWAHPDEDSSFYELKAYVLNILTRLGVPFGALVFAPSAADIYSKGMEIQNRGGKVLASMGIVSAKLCKALGVGAPVYYADLNWHNLLRVIRNSKVSYTEISRFPAVSRDLALLLNSDVEFVEIEKVAYATEKKLLKEVRLFDVYEGKNLEAGKKSYAVNFVLQDQTKTLTDKQIDTIMNKLITNLQDKLGAKLR